MLASDKKISMMEPLEASVRRKNRTSNLKQNVKYHWNFPSENKTILPIDNPRQSAELTSKYSAGKEMHLYYPIKDQHHQRIEKKGFNIEKQVKNVRKKISKSISRYKQHWQSTERKSHKKNVRASQKVEKDISKVLKELRTKKMKSNIGNIKTRNRRTRN